MLQWADSLLWCREAVANKNHTHACTHAVTHKHAWARLRSQTHGRILFAPSTADKYTHKTHTCTTVAECELWSQMLAHVFKANDIQWARYWENTSFHTKSFGSFILWLWGLKMGLSPDGPECSRMDLGPCFCLQWLVALHCKFSDTVFAKVRHNIWLFLSVCMTVWKQAYSVGSGGDIDALLYKFEI